MKRNYGKVVLLGIIFFSTSTSMVNAGFFSSNWLFSSLSDQFSRKSKSLIGFVCALPTKAWDNFGVIFKSDLRKAKKEANEKNTAAVSAAKSALEEKLRSQKTALNKPIDQAKALGTRVDDIAKTSQKSHEGTMERLGKIGTQQKSFEQGMTDRLADAQESIKGQLKKQQKEVADEIRNIETQRSELETALKKQHDSLSDEIDCANREKLEALKKAAQEQERRNKEIDKKLEQIEQRAREREEYISKIEQNAKQLAVLLRLDDGNAHEILAELRNRLQRQRPFERKQQKRLTSGSSSIFSCKSPVFVGGEKMFAPGTTFSPSFVRGQKREISWKK